MAAGGKSGWGLYMGETCRKGDFIGEYRGEIISDTEAELRGTIYDKRNLSYLFTLNLSKSVNAKFCCKSKGL
jgi:SET domain-containing protein